jgi:hypothetical protein
MKVEFCPVCEKVTPHKRAFGMGTLIAFFATTGLWVLAMPFYPIRCVYCGTEESTKAPAISATMQEEAQKQRRFEVRAWVAMGALLVVIFAAILIMYYHGP